MKLEEITAEVRPRTQWESVDLGVSLVRKHFSKLAQIWVFTVFPIWALLFLLLRDSPFWFITIAWFFLPLYERPLVYYLSRVLFNAKPRVRDVIKAYPRIIMPGLLHGLTIGRFSLARSLLMPLRVLENTKGSQYRNRRQAIMRSGGSTANYLSFVCVLMQIVMFIAFIFLIVSFIPQHMAPDWREMLLRFFTFGGFLDGLPNTLAWFAVALLLLAMSLVELFYVGCGFTLYLNSRSMVEGWDIEITFRRLATKITSLTTPLLILLGSFVFLSPKAVAQDEPPSYDHVKAEIREVLEDEDFKIHTEKVKVYQLRRAIGQVKEAVEETVDVRVGSISVFSQASPKDSPGSSAQLLSAHSSGSSTSTVTSSQATKQTNPPPPNRREPAPSWAWTLVAIPSQMTSPQPPSPLGIMATHSSPPACSIAVRSLGWSKLRSYH